MGAAFIIVIDTTTKTSRPKFVRDELFGVTDVSIYLAKFSLEGKINVYMFDKLKLMKTIFFLFPQHINIVH